MVYRKNSPCPDKMHRCTEPQFCNKYGCAWGERPYVKRSKADRVEDFIEGAVLNYPINLRSQVRDTLQTLANIMKQPGA